MPRRPAAPRGELSPEELDRKLDEMDPPEPPKPADEPPPAAGPDDTVRMVPVALAWAMGERLKDADLATQARICDESLALTSGFLPPLLAEALVAQRVFPHLKLVDLLINAVMREVGPVAKTERYEGTGASYNFRGIDAVVNATAAALRRSGLHIRPVKVERALRDAMTTNQRPTREVATLVTYRIQAPDDTFRDVEVPGESLDQADKGTAKAMSVALRIAALQTFWLPTTEPDPDSSYLTREGQHGISDSMSFVLRRLIDQGPLDRVLDEVPPVLREHAAWERPTVAGAEGTWAERLGARIAADIAALRNVDAAKELSQLLKDHHGGAYKHDGKTAVELLRLRWPVLVEEGRKTLDHCMQLIQDALDRQELDAAVEHARVDCEHGALPRKECDELLAVAVERAAHLPDVLEPEEALCEKVDVHEPHLVRYRTTEGKADRFRCKGLTESEAARLFATEPGTSEAPAVPEPLDPDRWAMFRARVGAVEAIDVEPGRPIASSQAVEDALRHLLDGTYGEPASAFGIDGLVAVEDAMKAAHRRDGKLTDEARARIEAQLILGYQALADAASDEPWEGASPGSAESAND